MLTHLPVKNPKPDASRCIASLLGTEKGKVPLIEYLVDDVVMKPVVTGLLGGRWYPFSSDRGTLTKHLDMFIDFWYRLGYDVVRFESGMQFSERKLNTADTAIGSTKDRAWADEHTGPIMSWEDFEQYQWPRIEDVDFFPFEYISSHLPDGMGMMTCHAAGIFEHLSWIMSYEGLSLALYDEPDLVRTVTDRIGALLLSFYRHLVQLPGISAVFAGDDMGFKTGTLISPEALRTYVLPWHRKIADIAHGADLPYLLHSCGNLESILPDLIDDVKIDGKHSFEDAIITAESFQEKYGSRIAVLGGVDLNTLSIGSVEQVRARTRQLVTTCGANGRFAVGSGNSIPSYIPEDNYLAMVDEALDVRGA